MAAELETPVAEPAVPPVSESKPLTIKPGDKYREAFEKISKAIEPKPEAAPTPVEPPSKESEAPSKLEETPSKPTDAAQSPLDLVTADTKQEPKEPEVPDELKDIPKEFDAKSQIKREDWSRLRKAADGLGEKVGQLKAEIAELKQAPKADPEEIARLSKERDEIKQALVDREELIKSVDVRLSEDYRALAKKRDDTVGKIASRARSYGIDGDTLVSALSLPDSKFKTDQIKAVMAEVEPDDRARINVLIEQLDGHNDALYEFEREAPKKYEEIQAKRDAAMREQQDATVKMVESEFGKLAESLPKDVVTLREVPDDVPGGTEWNQNIRTAKETALRVLSPGGADLQETAAIAYKGGHYDSLMKMFLQNHAELKEARQRLAEFDSSSPDFKGGQKPTTEAKLSPGEKYYKALAAQQAARET